MKPWKDMTKAERSDAALALTTGRNATSYRGAALLLGTSVGGIAGAIHRLNHPNYKPPSKQRAPAGPRVSGPSTYSERALTETWEERKARKALEKKTPPKITGQVISFDTDRRVKYRWTTEMKKRFVQMVRDKVQYKIIAGKLGVSVSACKHMREQLDLAVRRPAKGTFTHMNFRVGLDETQYHYIKRRGCEIGVSMADMVRAIIQKEMEQYDEVDIPVREPQGSSRDQERDPDGDRVSRAS